VLPSSSVLFAAVFRLPDLKHIELVVLDMVMQEMNGAEVLRALRFLNHDAHAMLVT
jgi:CheY-like chemotaxis protein